MTDHDDSRVRIRLRGVGKRFSLNDGVLEAFHAVDLDVRDGEFVSILGPSGCGKTTLIRVLAGLEPQTAGTVRIQHRYPSRPLSAMVFQEPSALPWMTVEANIGYGLRMQGAPASETRDRVAALLDMMALRPFATAYPHQLSGGMKQRVAVARALAVDPEILLMDEPFGLLDEQTRLTLQHELLRIWDASRKTVVFVTHSISEALLLSDRVVVMSPHPGTIREIVAVPFDRPRAFFDLSLQPAYVELARHLWSLLRAGGM